MLHDDLITRLRKPPPEPGASVESTKMDPDTLKIFAGALNWTIAAPAEPAKAGGKKKGGKKKGKGKKKK